MKRGCKVLASPPLVKAYRRADQVHSVLQVFKLETLPLPEDPHRLTYRADSQVFET